ncbi:ABC transporter substrate-binding protein [Pigmentiphaga sp. GD03639]|uniref:ABC transporter substrate-binding protein n=1 Tax=Pigmentiphaga daeguensis TaxID=414049 RepID=A0ABP3N0C4_9BURK|nr:MULTISPECIES: ABC transporter substrate-binding protein [unclassified Pigmentiphaga]MDH2236492.1 ABC transporter substrate-binding protein [Pigmentiphaga sp. GD03639]OVZ63488.1 nitrate ABC transporter substrate-binding protein [Pigmentiphaga sp. NML030171]
MKKIAALALTGLIAAWSVPAAAQQVIRVGWLIPAEEAKYWMMKRPAEFPQLGSKYKIEWVQFQGTSPVMQAFAAKAVDCGTQTPLSVGQGLIEAKVQTSIIAQHVFETPTSFSVYWAVKDDSPIKSVKDLKGKRIGVSVLGAGVYAPLVQMLEKNGLDPKTDVKMIETGFAPSEDAIRSGRVDAGVLNQPFAARAEAKGGLRKLFSVADQQPNFVHILEACRKDFVDQNPELVKAYIRDLTTAMGKVLANRPETLKVVSEVTKAPVSVLDTYLLKGNDFARDPGMAPNFPAIQSLLDSFTQAGLMSQKVDVASFRNGDIHAPIK